MEVAPLVAASRCIGVVGWPSASRGAVSFHTGWLAESLWLWHRSRSRRHVDTRERHRLGLPLAIPGWRRQYQSGLGNMEPERHLPPELRTGVRPARHRPDVPLLR